MAGFDGYRLLGFVSCFLAATWLVLQSRADDCPHSEAKEGVCTQATKCEIFEYIDENGKTVKECKIDKVQMLHVYNTYTTCTRYFTKTTGTRCADAYVHVPPNPPVPLKSKCYRYRECDEDVVNGDTVCVSTGLEKEHYVHLIGTVACYVKGGG